MESPIFSLSKEMLDKMHTSLLQIRAGFVHLHKAGCKENESIKDQKIAKKENRGMPTPLARIAKLRVG
jgi:hypothetical protein